MTILQNLSSYTTSKIVHYLNSKGLGKNRNFLKKLIEQEKLYYSMTKPYKLNRHKKRLFQMMDSLDEIYPNNWDMIFFLNRNRELSIMPLIRYQEFNITNSAGHSHKIKELFVGLSIRSGGKGLYVKSILGTRGTVTPIELDYSYLHSHLQGNSYYRMSDCFEMGQFCTGSAELLDIKSQLKTDFDTELFSLFLVVLKSLVEWESLEGGPYKKIDQLIGGKKLFKEEIYNNVHIHFGITGMIVATFIKNNDFSLSYNSQNFNAIINDSLKEKVKLYLIELFNSTGELSYARQLGKEIIDPIKGRMFHQLNRLDAENNINYISEREFLNPNSTDKPYTYFNKEKIFFELLEEETKTEPINLMDLTVNDLFIDKIVEDANKQYKKDQDRIHKIRGIYKSYNARKISEQSQISL